MIGLEYESGRIRILDVIRFRTSFGEFTNLVVDRMPVFNFEYKDDVLVAEDSGFVKVYKYDDSGLFGGREFVIPLKDGSVIRNTGQWHVSSPNGDFRHVGIATDPNGKFIPSMLDAEVYNNIKKWSKKHNDQITK